MKLAKTSAVLRLTIGMVLACLVMVAVGIVVLPSLIDKDRPGLEPVIATNGTAMALADELEFSMTDQEISATVAGRGATVVDLRRVPDYTTVIVDIPDSVVLEPAAHACYEFMLVQDKDVTFEKVDGCTSASPRT